MEKIMRSFKYLLLAALSLQCSACFRVNVESAHAGGRIVEQREHFFVFGTVGESQIEMARVCPEGIASFGDGFTAQDVAFAIASVGVYTPRTVWVQCLSPSNRGNG